MAPDHALWESFKIHLAQMEMAPWVLDKFGTPLSGVHFLVVVNQEAVVGHISIKLQFIVIPGTDWSGGPDTALARTSTPLTEAFVQTFAVEEAHRRRGHGKSLQLAALALAKDIGAYQMRSWSSLDKSANYILKLALGFAVHPAILETATGLKVSGVYFVKTV